MSSASDPKAKSPEPKYSADPGGGPGGSDPETAGMVPLWLDVTTAKTLLTALAAAVSKPVHAKDDKGNPKPKNDNGGKGKKGGGGGQK